LKRTNKAKYWITYRLPGGKQRREVFKDNPYSIEEARNFESKRRVQKRENRIFDVKPETKMTFQELTDWYLNLEKIKSLSYCRTLKIDLKKFNSVFGNVIVSQIKPCDLENLQAKRKAEGKADATIDLEIGAARGMINKAFDNDLISGDTLRTFKKVKKMLKSNSNARDRILSPDEFNSLLAHLPHHAKAIFVTGCYTGMRLGEILPLTWGKVSLKDRTIKLEARDTKDKEKRDIPICDELYSMLSQIPRGIQDSHIFLYRGKPVKSIKNALIRACRDAKIPYGRFVKDGLIYHDLRRTFNTYMRKAGVPESVIMNITGHSTRAMFDRYNTIDMDDKRQAVNVFQGFFRNASANVDQNVDQVGKNEKVSHCNPSTDEVLRVVSHA
jgi:integrase